ncbi:MAG: glycosyltransferase family 9 protein [Terrimicrobiaceae bacterium]
MPGCYAVFHKQLGDLVLLEPALSKLRDHHGEPVRCMTRRGHLPLLGLMAGVHPQGGTALAWRSHLYCFDPLNKSAVRSLLSPARVKRCILPERREMKWFHRRVFREVIVPELGDRYIAEYFWKSTPVPCSHSFRPPRLNLPPNHWKPDGLGSEPFVLVNPTSGWRQKSWLPDRWAQTLGALHDERAVRFLMTNASMDWQIQHCREIQEKSGPLVRSLASGTTLENFLWLCSRARAVFTVDGAASHLARAFGVKCVTLFGPTNSRNWHYPAAGNVAIQAPPSKDHICRLRNLPSDAVIEAARQLLR